MIQLTRLNGETFSLNACLIEQIQSYPDTTITLLSGKKLVVKEPERNVVKLISDYYRNIGYQGFIKGVGEADE